MGLNWTLMAIPIGLIAGFAPTTMKVRQMRDAEGVGKNSNAAETRCEKVYDNREGRDALNNCKDAMKKEDFEKATRCKNAELNFHENYPLFIGAVIIANFTGVDKMTANSLAYGWIVLRLIYNGLYIYGTTPARSTFRSLFYALSSAASITLILQGAMKA